MNLEEIKAYLGDIWPEFEGLLRSSLKTDVKFLESINSGLLLSSGKRLRPMLCLLTAKALGTVSEDSVKYAVACELLHNATLFHDDVADGGLQRRGKPTVMALFGPSAAVLIGDFWLSRAMDLIMSARTHEKVIGYFTRTIMDLAEGEMLQLEQKGSEEFDEQTYLRIISLKTASLFRTAAMSAATSINAPQAHVEAVDKFALALGMAFQIKDDILDYTGDDKKLGKAPGMDIKEQKITLPLLGALNMSNRAPEIREMIENIPSNPQHCEEILKFVLDNGGVDYAAASLEEYIKKACEALSSLPDSKAKDFLTELARYNSFRQV